MIEVRQKDVGGFFFVEEAVHCRCLIPMEEMWKLAGEKAISNVLSGRFIGFLPTHIPPHPSSNLPDTAEVIDII